MAGTSTWRPKSISQESRKVFVGASLLQSPGTPCILTLNLNQGSALGHILQQPHDARCSLGFTHTHTHARCQIHMPCGHCSACSFRKALRRVLLENSWLLTRHKYLPANMLCLHAYMHFKTSYCLHLLTCFHTALLTCFALLTCLLHAYCFAYTPNIPLAKYTCQANIALLAFGIIAV